jgi:ABC-type antimicrobial peptide transport system permease subunit
METIRSIDGVDHVVARAHAVRTFYAPDDVTMYSNDVAAIDVDNPDEVRIGVSNITGSIPGITNPTIEQLLNIAVLRPVIISSMLSVKRGISIGDTIRILPANATKLYATPEEIVDATSPILKAQLEQSIRDNASRIVQFKVIGIIVDGSEAPFKPVAKDTDSLSGLVPSEECIYARLNDTMAYVHNTVDGEVSFFLVGASFQNGASAFAGSVDTNTGAANVVANDIRLHFQGYIDYATLLIRVILSVLTVSAWISCGVLIKTIAQMNIEQKMREIGILRAIGFQKNAISEIVISQILVMASLGTAAGLGIGLIPPQFFDVSEVSRFLSYNKEFAMAEVIVVVSLVSTIIAIVAGLALPIVSGLVPIIGMRKWSVVEMMTPGYMHQKQDTSGKKKRGRRSKQ